MEVFEIGTPLPAESASPRFLSAPVPQVVEELAEACKVFSQDTVQQRFGAQTIELPAISLDEKIVEMPVIQTQGKTQQVVNTHVQQVVNTVKVEKPERATALAKSLQARSSSSMQVWCMVEKYS